MYQIKTVTVIVDIFSQIKILNYKITQTCNKYQHKSAKNYFIYTDLLFLYNILAIKHKCVMKNIGMKKEHSISYVFHDNVNF